jgi:hypothetical protein
MTVVAASGLLLYRGDCSAVFVVGPVNTRTDHKYSTTAGLSVLWVPYATHNILKPVPTLPR